MADRGWSEHGHFLIPSSLAGPCSLLTGTNPSAPRENRHGFWHTHLMRSSHSLRLCVWIIALAMFGVRLGGIHLHLCLDGQEPPASLHIEHEEGHADYHHSEGSHQDQDVDLLAQGVSKKADPDKLDLFVGAFSVAAILSVQQQISPERLTSIQPTGPPRFVLPPLRAPPAHAS
jgi:hypothetical protein